MMKHSSASVRWVAAGAALLALFSLLALAGVSLLGTSGNTTQAVANPTATRVAQVAIRAKDTPAPTSTPQAQNTATPVIEPTQIAAVAIETPSPEAVAEELLPDPSPPEVVVPPTTRAQPTKALPKPTPAVAILPNGVRYGDRYPNLPNRIVRIASPSIELDTKVYEVYAKKNEWEVADYAAGHHYNSLNPGDGGNIVLSGHNNWRGEVFRYLEFLKPGDEINVWTLDGKQYKYEVQEVKKLKEAGATYQQRVRNGEVMKPTLSEQLTLITCWPYTTYTHRLVVIAKPVK